MAESPRFVSLAVILYIALFSSCTNNDNGNETSQTYAYCVYSADKFCTEGPYTTCQGDGIPSNSCPYGSSSSAQSPSSSSRLPSSSSSTVQSSSSVIVFSSSSVPSSSSSQLGSLSSSSVASVGGSCNISGYRTVKIGTQTWMAENLNCDVSGSVCYDNDQANCDKFGRLYKWETAMSVCPSGWHLPSNYEWSVLINFVGGESTAGTKLKANSNLWDTNTGMDNYGFAALPGGWCDKNGSFSYVSYRGFWWGSSENENDATEAYRLDMYHNGEYVADGYFNKSREFSVRCVQD